MQRWRMAHRRICARIQLLGPRSRWSETSSVARSAGCSLHLPALNERSSSCATTTASQTRRLLRLWGAGRRQRANGSMAGYMPSESCCPSGLRGCSTRPLPAQRRRPMPPNFDEQLERLLHRYADPIRPTRDTFAEIKERLRVKFDFDGDGDFAWEDALILG